MARLALRLLGPIEIELEGQAVTSLNLAKARALLAYLAVECDHAHPRRALAGLLWADYAETSALASLRNALATLRRALGDRDALHPCLLADRETIAFDAACECWVDTAALDALQADSLASAATHTLQAAAELYRGAFLADLSLDDSAAYDEWLTLRREHYRLRVVSILCELAERYLDQGSHDQAEACARRILALNPLDEDAHRMLMRALALDGRRAEALDGYRACAQRLERELGIGPSAETRALRDAIRVGELMRPVTPQALPAATSEHTPAVALAVPPSPTHQLPPPPADFVGRDAELDELVDAVRREDRRILCIRGPGGMGKTSLALAVAERLESDYREGQLYIEMRGTGTQPVTPAEAMAHVIRTYFPLAPVPEEASALSASYRSALHGKRALILLDNARDGAQIEPLLPPSSCLLLITTRQRFSLAGMRALDLGTIAEAEGARLLQSVAPRVTDDEGRELAHACGLLPLALRVTGSALAERVDLSAAAYLARLGPVGEGLPDELSSVGASLSLSDTMLAEPLRERWYELAVFPDTFDLDGARAVWGIDEAREADATLGALLRYSLVEYSRATSRYRLHDLTRAYAMAHLTSDRAEMARERHASHYVALLRTIGRELSARSSATLPQLERLDREMPNVIAGQTWAARWSEAPGDLGMRASRLCCNYVGDLSQWYQHCGSGAANRLTGLGAWSIDGLKAAQRVGDLRAEANARALLADSLKTLGTDTSATVHLDTARRIAREVGDRRLEGWILCILAGNQYLTGDLTRARMTAEEGLALAEEVGDHLLEAETLKSIGYTHYAAGDGETALSFGLRALQVVETWGLDLVLPSVLKGISADCYVLDNPQRSLSYAQRAQAAAERLGDMQAQREIEEYVGRALTALGEPERAIRYLERALALRRDTGVLHSVGFNLHWLGQAYAAMGDHRQAIDHQQQALDVAREIGEKRLQALALEQLSLLHKQLGENERAMALASESLELYEAIDHRGADAVRERLAQWEQAGV